MGEEAEEMAKVTEVEFYHCRKDGSEFPVSLLRSVVKDEDGDEQAVVGIARDITRRKQIEEELVRSNKELEQFAYIASHDMQEPLRKITAFGSRRKTHSGAALDEKGRDYLERMENAAKRMRELIEDLLAYSRIATRAKPFEPTSLKTVISEVLSDLEVAIARSKGLLDVGELPIVNADRSQMRQLFQNLIANALKFHQEGKPPEVNIKSQAINSDFVEITVSDNGVGFDRKYLDRIFKPFARLHTRDEFPGTGMGLAICEKIVRRHGGEITAKSKVGQGATFIIKLPFREA